MENTEITNVTFGKFIGSKYFILFILLCLGITASWFFPMSRDFENYNNWCLRIGESLQIAVERDPLFGVTCVAANYISIAPMTLVAPLWIFASLFLKYVALRSEIRIFFWSSLTYVAFFFVTQEMTQIRAALASAALGYAFIQIVNKNYTKFGILCFIAVASHLSSLLLIPILLFLPILIKTKLRFIVTVVVCQIVFLLSILIPGLQGALIGVLSNLVGYDIRISTYLYNYDMDNVVALIKNARVGFFLIVTIIVLLKEVVKDQYCSTKLIYGSTCLSSIAILVLTLSYNVPIISLRLFELFAIPLSIMVGAYIRSIENVYHKYLSVTYLLLILFGTFYNTLDILT